MEAEKDVRYLRIENKADRVTVASILFDNGYSVQPVRRKKNGKTFEYLVKYWVGKRGIEEEVDTPE